jgi:hypothetical protein
MYAALRDIPSIEGRVCTYTHTHALRDIPSTTTTGLQKNMKKTESYKSPKHSLPSAACLFFFSVLIIETCWNYGLHKFPLLPVTYILDVKKEKTTEAVKNYFPH